MPDVVVYFRLNDIATHAKLPHLHFDATKEPIK